MFGFLFKLVVFVAIVAGLLFFVVPKLINSQSKNSFSLPNLSDISLVGSQLKNLNVTGMGKQLSQALDGLVTHSGSSPVVLGVQITDNSLDTVVKVLRNLPPDQMDQIKSFVCQPASPSSKPK